MSGALASLETELSRPGSAESITIVEQLQRWLGSRADQSLIHFLPDGDHVSDSLTFRRLDQRARAIAARLQQTASPGDRILLVYPPGLEFITALFGCMTAGMIAVPCCSPVLDGSVERFSSLARIAEDCEPSAVLTCGKDAERFFQLCRQHGSLSNCTGLSTGSIPDTDGSEVQKLQITPETVAFLQYTSGSTGDPKGVVVTHRNITGNLVAMQRAFLSRSSAGVSWLPVYHDMGLVGTILPAVWTGVPLSLMPPLAMLKHPDRWLATISRTRADICPAPNFAFDYCVQRVTETQKASLDLSCWKVACIGAEPVRAETMRRFAEAFASCGFRPEAFYPCYGLAEATLFVTGGTPDAPPVVRCASTIVGEASARIATVTREPDVTPLAGTSDAELVGCGRAATGHEVLIVDPETCLECPLATVGEIWVKGPSVAVGYWNRPQETQATFRGIISDRGTGPYLRTGDLGLLHEGELFVTGRIKDLIVIRGQNHYPADLEETVALSHAVFQGRFGVAFGCPVEGEERLIIVQEYDRRSASVAREVLINVILAAISDRHQLRAHDVRLVRVGTLPRTTSGKLRRGECRDRYLTGTLANTD